MYYMKSTSKLFCALEDGTYASFETQFEQEFLKETLFGPIKCAAIKKIITTNLLGYI